MLQAAVNYISRHPTLIIGITAALVFGIVLVWMAIGKYEEFKAVKAKRAKLEALRVKHPEAYEQLKAELSTYGLDYRLEDVFPQAVHYIEEGSYFVVQHIPEQTEMEDTGKKKIVRRAEVYLFRARPPASEN